MKSFFLILFSGVWMKFTRNDIIPSHRLTTIINSRNTDQETQTTTTQRTGTLNTAKLDNQIHDVITHMLSDFPVWHENTIFEAAAMFCVKNTGQHRKFVVTFVGMVMSWFAYWACIQGSQSHFSLSNQKHS